MHIFCGLCSVELPPKLDEADPCLKADGSELLFLLVIFAFNFMQS